jgi:hypothetical protein
MSDHSVNLSNESPAPTLVRQTTILNALSLADRDSSPDYVLSSPTTDHNNEEPLPVPPTIFTQPPINLSDEGPWPPLSPESTETALHLVVSDEDHTCIAVTIA